MSVGLLSMLKTLYARQTIECWSKVSEKRRKEDNNFCKSWLGTEPRISDQKTLVMPTSRMTDKGRSRLTFPSQSLNWDLQACKYLRCVLVLILGSRSSPLNVFLLPFVSSLQRELLLVVPIGRGPGGKREEKSSNGEDWEATESTDRGHTETTPLAQTSRWKHKCSWLFSTPVLNT